MPPRAYVRCRGWPHAGVDRHASDAAASAAWDLYELQSAHPPCISSPGETTELLLALAA